VRPEAIHAPFGVWPARGMTHPRPGRREHAFGAMIADDP